ncbi:MAG: hypothetical protein ACJ8EL_13895 [Rhizomicrobium sp.]
MLKYRKRVSHRELTAYQRHELLTGEISYPVMGYTGYGSGVGGETDLRAFISDEMREDWKANRDELLAFWASGEYTTGELFADSTPWLFVCGSPGTLPWAAEQFDEKAKV